MAKFCSKCGRPLVEGVPCECEKQQEVVQNAQVENEPKVETAQVKTEVNNEQKVENEQTAGNEEPSVVGIFFRQYVDTVKGMFKSPIETIKKQSKNFYLGIIGIVITTILFGILMNGYIDHILSEFGISLAVVNTAVTTLAKYGINLKIGNLGLKFGIAMFVMSAIMVGIVFVMTNYVYKKKLDIKDCVAVIGTCEIFLTIGIVIAFVISYLSLLLSGLVMLLFTLAFFIHIQVALTQVSELTKTQVIYTVFATIFIPFIALSIIALAVSYIDIAIMIYKKAVANIYRY